MPFSRITQNSLRLLRSIITALRGAQNLAVPFVLSRFLRSVRLVLKLLATAFYLITAFVSCEVPAPSPSGGLPSWGTAQLPHVPANPLPRASTGPNPVLGE